MSRDGEPWYRPPVVWLGLGIFVASIAGCIALIVASRADSL